MELAIVPNSVNMAIKQVPMMRKEYSQQKEIQNLMKKKVEEHRAMISPLYPEEVGIEDFFSSLEQH